jgi:hypothetical protein
MSWRKRLFEYLQQSRPAAGPPTPQREPDLANVYVGTETESRQRAEAAMPGTASIMPLLTLEPPPANPDTQSKSVRDFGPDPIAEYALAYQARATFSVPLLASDITPDLRRYFVLPTLYVRTPEGRITYMVSADAPQRATGVVAGWSLRKDDKTLVNNIHTGALGLARWLATRPEGFAATEPAMDAITAQHGLARRIIEIRPSEVAILALPKQRGQRFDGKQMWRTLHALGLLWGDLDQFQWHDPTDQTDHLFWAEVDDGRLGYALPEEIASGRQHFIKVRFVFDIARAPHPAHVLGQMIRAAEAFAKELECNLMASADGRSVDGHEALAAVVSEVEGKLRACGVKPGSGSVLRLR